MACIYRRINYWWIFCLAYHIKSIIIMKFYLKKLPVISISIFYVFCFIAAYFYPGSEKEIINFKSENYSFTHNFLSELGCLKTNTDQTNPDIIQADNTISMLFFNSGLILIGLTISLFYLNFKNIFNHIKDNKACKSLSLITSYIGFIAGIMFSGVGFVPDDLSFEWHVFFANGAFLLLFFVSIFHTLTIYYSNNINNIYSVGYLIFTICLLFYVYLIFYGPQINPYTNFTEEQLILQVVSQKMIVIVFTFSMLSQVIALNRFLIYRK